MKDKILNILLPISWILILISCCFLFAFTSKAANLENYDLPFNVSQHSGLNSCMDLETVVSVYESYFVPNVQPYYPTTDFTKALLFLNDAPNPNNEGLIQVIVIPNPTISTSFANDSQYENFNITSNQIVVSPGGRDFTMNLKLDRTIANMYVGSNQFDGSVNIFGSHNTITNAYGTTTIHYPFLLYGLDELKDGSGNFVVLTNYAPVVIPTGHATAPDTFEDPVYETGHAKPNKVPQLTINNYTWTTPPTPDLSTLENTAKSIFDILQWIASNLIGEFSNLITNIQNVGNFIGSTIQYYGNLIISTIQNGITTFYNNMVSLFEPIASVISYISEPMSGTVIYDNISGTTLIQSINSVDNALTTFQGTFTGLSEPNSFVIPIHLENLPSSWFGNQSVQYLDLSWINYDMRILIRGFMWAIITYALFITIVDSIANYINGGGDES